MTAALLASTGLVAPLHAGAKQSFECTVLFAPPQGHPAHPRGRLSVRADDAEEAACAASGEVGGCRASCRPAAPVVSGQAACVPQSNDPPGQRCLAYVCVPKDRAWGSGAEYRVMARGAAELASARRRTGDGADQRYNCMGEPEYESLRKANGWPSPGGGAAR